MDKNKRYQIFVSSTVTDLMEERRKVMETILYHDCFPVGLELYPAMDDELLNYLKRIIDDSDYYLLIIGGRYGSMDNNGVSWTEKEYDYAVSKGIPILAFIHKDFTQLPANKIDLDVKKKEKLIAFIKKVSRGRLIKKWTDSLDLALGVATSLNSVLKLQPRIGWVRADSFVSIDVQKDNNKNNKTEISKELKSYWDYLERLAINKSYDLFSNGGIDHTSILMTVFFDHSKEVRIYTSSFRKDLMSSEPFLSGLRDFLNNSNHKLFILTPKFDLNNNEPWMVLLKRSANQNRDLIQIRLINDINNNFIAENLSDNNCGFAVFDNDKFRFEYEPENYRAFASFNQPDRCEELIVLFDTIFEKSEPIELH